jgi:hypothetical protein
MVAGVVIATLHYLRYGPKHVPEDNKPDGDKKVAAG